MIADRREVPLSQLGRQVAKCPRPVPSQRRRFDGGPAAIAADNLDRSSSEPLAFFQHHRHRQWLFASGTGRAPDPQRPPAKIVGQPGDDALDDGANLIDLSPKIGFLHRERVHDAAPLIRVGGVFEQVVVVQERIKAARDHQRSEAIGELIGMAGVVEQTEAFMDQFPDNCRDLARQSQRLGAKLHSRYRSSGRSRAVESARWATAITAA